MKKQLLNLISQKDTKKTLLISLTIFAVVITPGIFLSLWNWNTPQAESAPLVSQRIETAPVVETPPPAPPTPVAETPPAVVTPPTPVPPPAPVAVVPKSAPAPVVAAVVPSVPTIVYQDNFGRKGELDGSSPDAKNTNGAKWTVSSGPGAYATKGGAVSDNNAVYDAAYLPVNGTSGITLDGKQSFTLSAKVSTEQAGYWMGISLNTAPITNGHNMTDGGISELILGKGYTDAYHLGADLNHVENDYTPGTPFVISMTYHATKSAITYTVGDKTIATLTGVMPDQIAALAAVSLGNGHSGPTAAISNFTLTVGGLD
jgi:hypothetical protein